MKPSCKQKTFCIDRNKTGTISLETALTQLKFQYFEASYRDLCKKSDKIYQGLMQAVQKHTGRELRKDYLGEPGFAFSSKPDPATCRELAP